MDVNQLDTPALIVDLERMKRNLTTMQTCANELNVSLRPHTKAHKIPQIAQMQISAGARGICVAKLGEAEVMAQNGLDDILITTPIAGERKINRLVALRRRLQQHPRAKLIQVIDHPTHVAAIAAAARRAGVTVDVMIEVESGQCRCGVAVGEDLTELVRLVCSTDGVRYAGLQAYSGHLQLVRGYDARHARARAAVVGLFDFIDSHLEPEGLAPPIVSGGGTGTFGAYQGLGFTEIQAGSYLFMDAAYEAIGDGNDATKNEEFEVALKVVSTVISTPSENRAVVDAGMKCLSIDLGMPKIEGVEGLRYQSGGDEHGIIHSDGERTGLTIGQRVTMIPSHCDTTLNNFDTLHAVKNGVVVESWPILGRGRSD
eukprot:CAMPEP_0172498176 /NCGR_PEP_ID=MMETSP1066-20121228/110398_1 /TAXON_ID=671091 /ORGANISM="Coscinodiscus wailesii, Strain CCMP2513" /LENGTH=371 /DNA_ID=CAMNT_0013271361 /DNA_START=178 /DNA_END=1293 /DNA_ORIENTATION=-